MKRLLCVLLLISLTFTLLSGCASFDNEENKPETTTTTSPTTESTEPTTQPTTAPATKPTKPTKPTETPTKPTETPTKAPTQPQLSAWQSKYIDFIKQTKDSSTSYCLIYLDSDSIPELFINGNCEAAGSRVCSYNNGVFNYQQLRRLGGAYYIPESGLIYNANGNMGHYSHQVYKLSGSIFSMIFEGYRIDTYVPPTGEDDYSEGSIVTTYTLGASETPVTEDEFKEALNNVFNENISTYIPSYDSSLYDYNGIISAIKNW